MTSAEVQQRYNTIATQYSKMESLPGELLTHNFLRRRLGNIQNLKILDLGCGSGLYARMTLSMGAASVVGVDLSEGMLTVAREIETQLNPPRKPGTISYHLANCAQPINHLSVLKNQENTFDLVMANWLLSYADSPSTLKDMWSNIAMYLRPGGRFIGLVGSMDPEFTAGSATGKYGCRYTVVEKTEFGYKLIVELGDFDDDSGNGEGLKIDFPGFCLPQELHEVAPMTVGMKRAVFASVEKSDLEEGADQEKEEEYWKAFFDGPYFSTCESVKL